MQNVMNSLLVVQVVSMNPPSYVVLAYFNLFQPHYIHRNTNDPFGFLVGVKE